MSGTYSRGRRKARGMVSLAIEIDEICWRPASVNRMKTRAETFGSKGRNFYRQGRKVGRGGHAILRDRRRGAGGQTRFNGNMRARENFADLRRVLL